MRRLATALLLGLLVPSAAFAQRVTDITVKQIFAVNADSLAKAKTLGAGLTPAVFARMLNSRYASPDSTVRFTAVILSDPLNSGLASANGTSAPGRVHVFMRDVAAATDAEGFAGYGVQVVDQNYATDGLLTYAPGAVVRVTGKVTYFDNGLAQVTPTTLTLVADTYTELGLPDAIVQPIPVTLPALNGPGVSDGSETAQATINLDNFPRYTQEYVRIEGLRVRTSTSAPTGRPTLIFETPDRTSYLALRDVSLRYRNDRRNTGYETFTPRFNVRTTAYEPPPAGAAVNVSGFTLFSPFDNTNLFNPNQNLAIAPFADSDVQVLAGAPPTVSNVSFPTGIVNGAQAVTVTASAVAGADRTLTGVELRYSVNGGTPTVVAMTLTSGSTYSAQIPASALADGAFVEYSVRATDNSGAQSDAPARTFRVLANGIRRIADIQTTANGGGGASPFSGARVTAASGQLQIDAVVQTDFAATGFLALQDDAGLAPFSGIEVDTTADVSDVRTLRPGDRIRITGAKVFEATGLTRLDSLTYTVTGSGAPYGFKPVTTTALTDPGTAEAHEGMLLQLNDVAVVAVNADAPAQFGEFTVRTTGGTGAIRVDDLSRGFPDTYNQTLAANATFSFIRGLWRFSNSNFKLEPGTLADVMSSVANGREELPAGFGMGAAYPNPLRATATLPYRLTASGPVRLAVYDALGRRVAVLVDAALGAGDHTATLDARGLAAGLYVARLEQDGAVTTRTFVVAR